MSRPETLAGVSNHGRLSCVPIRNVSPSLSPTPLCSSFIISLCLSVSNLLCFHCPLLIPLLLSCSSSHPSLPLVFLQSESCLCCATRSSFPAYLSALGSCFHDSLDVTGKMPFRARVSLADPFHLAACGPCVFTAWRRSAIKVWPFPFFQHLYSQRLLLQFFMGVSVCFFTLLI